MTEKLPKLKLDIETARLLAKYFGDKIYNDIIIIHKEVREDGSQDQE